MIAPASLKPVDAGDGAASMRRPLRGMIAPASLKLRRYQDRTPPTGSSTPGHDCPGLIEATARDRRLQPLRGMIAPASLKLSATSTTPGHDCPGLIEASDAAHRALAHLHD